MEVSSWENHLFLWSIYTMAMLNNQMVIGLIGLVWGLGGSSHECFIINFGDVEFVAP